MWIRVKTNYLTFLFRSFFLNFSNFVLVFLLGSRSRQLSLSWQSMFRHESFNQKCSLIKRSLIRFADLPVPKTPCAHFVCVLSILYTVSVLIFFLPPLHQPMCSSVILDCSATRLKMLLTNSFALIKKFECFYWLMKNECAAKMKITKALRSPFYFRPEWRHLRWCALRKQIVTIPNRSEEIVNVSAVPK